MSSVQLHVAMLMLGTLATRLAPVLGEGFLRARRQGGVYHQGAAMGLTEDFQAAMGAVLGCGSSLEQVNTSAIEQALMPIWRALPKMGNDHVEWRQLRYVAHRYFMQRSSLLLHGFEPTRPVDTSHPAHLGAADILSKQFPALVDMLMEGKRSAQGFSLQDAIAMVATLEQVILKSEDALLEGVYTARHFPVNGRLLLHEVREVLEEYMIHWLMGAVMDGPVLQMVIQNRSVLEENFLPHWPEIRQLVDGTVKSMAFMWQQHPRPRSAGKAISREFSFQDASAAVGGITKSFASYWETECQAIKASLVRMDTSNTGRVKLSDFYGANLDGEWRFGESEAYLREMGALDESSAWRGKQVIIPNYLQGASNCIVSRPHFLVCCVNECEDILGDVERAVGAPVADPAEVLDVVGNMSSYDDEPAPLDGPLRSQLRQIADSHGGKVPVHGRLFAQWLHYVFPRECPFPHKVGTVSPATPNEFGDSFIATTDEVAKHARSAGNASLEEEAQWMSQWSEEEELIGDYSLHVRSPWRGQYPLALGSVSFLALGLALAAVRWAPAAGHVSKGSCEWTKAHFV